MTPSSHVPESGTESERQANRDEFARTNTYHIQIEFPDGTVVELPRDGQVIRNRAVGTAEYATAWDIAIPLMEGETKISAWPEGSGGVGGYIERRQTVIRWTRP